jgi:hypothetical protein
VYAADAAQRQKLIVDCGEFRQKHERQLTFCHVVLARCHGGALPEFCLGAGK